MPNIETEFAETHSSKAFAVIDSCSSFWQMPLHTDIQPLYVFMRLEGVVMPTCTTQRGYISVANFQEKSGRLINEDGVLFNPNNLSSLIDSDIPQTVSELCEYVHALKFLFTSIPTFSERLASLQGILELAYARAGGSRKKKSIARFLLSDLPWTKTHANALYDLQKELKAATRFAHRDHDMVFCIHTEASDNHWAVMAAQCSHDDLNKPSVEEAHQALAFLTSTFSVKEAFAVVQAFRKLDYLLTCDVTTRIFTNHQNMLFVFNPFCMEPSLGQNKILKVVRWAPFLSPFTYRFEHIPGDSKT